jgi:hypothetical protein
MTITKADGSAPLSNGGIPPTEEARQKTRAFLGDESKWKNVRIRLQMVGPPGYPGMQVSLTGDGRLKYGKTELPPVDPTKTKEVFRLFIEEAFTEIDVESQCGVPGEIAISLELSRGLWRHRRIECFVQSQPQRFARLVTCVQGFVDGR